MQSIETKKSPPTPLTKPNITKKKEGWWYISGINPRKGGVGEGLNTHVCIRVCVFTKLFERFTISVVSVLHCKSNENCWHLSDYQLRQGKGTFSVVLGQHVLQVVTLCSWQDVKITSLDSFLVEHQTLDQKEFESQKKKQKNFLLQSQLSVLTCIWCLFHPHVTAMARKRPWSFCQKCRYQVTPKHAYTLEPWPNEVGVDWLCCCPGIV